MKTTWISALEMPEEAAPVLAGLMETKVYDASGAHQPRRQVRPRARADSRRERNGQGDGREPDPQQEPEGEDAVRPVQLREHKEMNAGLLGGLELRSGRIPDRLEDATKLHVRRVFDKYGRNLTRAAEALDVSRNTVRKYL